MSKTNDEISKKLNTQKDINTINGYAGVDKLNELKQKYKYITLAFNKAIQSSPESIESFIKTKKLENYLNGLFEKFDSNTINISVVAEVSSGKSTFLNALIFEKKVLDAKMGETTAKVFKISYGEDIDSDDLKAKISKINSTTKDKISEENFALEDININDYIVNLTSDNEKLKKGIVLYDTPGFGTLNEKVMSKLIKEAVNRSDAVILLLDISKGLKKDEAKFIQEALSYIKEDKRFIVLNKFDAAIDEDEDEDEDEIQEQINKVVLDTKNELARMSTNIDRSVLDRQTYYLSAIKALSGKSKNKPEILEFSRFPIFEESFWHRIVEAKKETFEDNVKDLVKEGTIVIDEVKSKITNFNTIITQTNSLILNMEKVSKEIKEIVSKQSKIFTSINKELNQNTNIVWDEADLFEKKMKNLIDNIAQKALNSIPNEEVKKEDFEEAYKEAIEEVNKNFIKNNTIFIERINSDIIEKEKKVNKTIDTLNMKIKDEKFKELRLQEIPKIKTKEANGETKQLDSLNRLNLSIEKDEVKTNYVVSTIVVEEDDTTAASAAGATMGGGAGAAIGSVVPVLGTTLGGAIGTAIGGIIGGFFGGSSKREAELEARYEEEMQKIRYEHEQSMAQMKYEAAVKEAKNDFLYELKTASAEHINSYITEKRNSIDRNYRAMLSEITSVSFNAQNILRDMQTIIEDPNEQKQVIDDNKEKINELNIFLEEIERCFQL